MHKGNGINSYDRKKFIEGKKYWTFYMEVSKKGNTLLNYTGMVQVLLKKIVKNRHDIDEVSLEFEILSCEKVLGRTMQHNFPIYLNGYGCASCNFFEEKSDAESAHDRTIIDYAKRLNTYDRGVFHKKLKGVKPEASSQEKEAVDWYNSLGKSEKKHVLWLKKFYEFPYA